MRWFYLVILTGLTIFAQEATVISQPVNPNRVFSTPTANVLNSLDVLLSGGSVVGLEEERYFLGNIYAGFGNLMELEVSTSNFVDALKKKSATLPASSFKMTFLPSNSAFGLSMLVKKTLWNERTLDTYKYYTRFSDVFVILGYRKEFFSLNVGFNLHDMRIKTYSYTTGEMSDEIKKEEYGVFGNLLIRANEKTYAMIEFTPASRVSFPSEGSISPDDIEQVYAVTLGGRYFFTYFFSLDAGVLYRSDFRGPADAVINVILNLAVPLGKAIQK